MISILKDKLSSIPKNPGVYFFKNKNDKIIYIGKAKSLKKRVSSYFNKKNHDLKTSVMIKHIHDIDFLVVKNEAEALITESNLIKINKPRYNVYLKDDKTFPYIRITKEDYPKLEIVRFKHFNKDNHTYFGPYTKSRDLRNIVKLLYKVFPLKTCDIKKRESCFCGFCMSKKEISNDKYLKIMNQVTSFLKGKTESVVSYLNNEMLTLSESLDYEKAAVLRDQIVMIKNFYKTENHQITNVVNRDYLGVSSEQDIGMVTLIKYRNSKLISREIFEINTCDDSNENITGFIKQYYLSTFDFPKEIIIQNDFVSQLEIDDWMDALNRKKPKIIIPKIGDKRQKLNLCIKNSELQLKRILSRKKRRKEFVSKMVISCA